MVHSLGFKHKPLKHGRNASVHIIFVESICFLFEGAGLPEEPQLGLSDSRGPSGRGHCEEHPSVGPQTQA